MLISMNDIKTSTKTKTMFVQIVLLRDGSVSLLLRNLFTAQQCQLSAQSAGDSQVLPTSTNICLPSSNVRDNDFTERSYHILDLTSHLVISEMRTDLAPPRT